MMPIIAFITELFKVLKDSTSSLKNVYFDTKTYINKDVAFKVLSARHGGLRRKGRQLKLMGFDIDMGIEMAKALGVKAVFVDTLWPGIIPALDLGRIDIIFGGMSVTEGRKKLVDFADPFMTVGQTVLLNAKHTDRVQSYKDLNDPDFMRFLNDFLNRTKADGRFDQIYQKWFLSPDWQRVVK